MSVKFDDFLKEQLQDPEFKKEKNMRLSSQSVPSFRQLLMPGNSPA